MEMNWLLVIQLMARELQGIQRSSIFLINIYIQSSWGVAPFNDIQLMQRLHNFDDVHGSADHRSGGDAASFLVPKSRVSDHHSLFSQNLSSEGKAQLIWILKDDRGLHLVQPLPRTVPELSISQSFFRTIANNDSFLNIPIQERHESQ